MIVLHVNNNLQIVYQQIMWQDLIGLKSHQLKKIKIKNLIFFLKHHRSLKNYVNVDVQ